jgi:hypothetical protein
MELLVKSKFIQPRKVRIVGGFVSLLLMTGCGGDQSESPNTYGARAGEEGAKYFKTQNPGVVASEESASQYCASMAEEGSKQNGWTFEETLQAGESCSIWFATEMFRK